MAAKSQKDSNSAFFLTQFFFNTDQVNSDIDQYNTHENEDVSRLFHGIYLDFNKEEPKTDLNKKSTIKDLLINEESIEANLKASL